jgi:DNA-binding transcriptional LysR family regulator
MEIKQLQYFLEVCRCGSFSGAAQRLYVTQQGISKAISTLEHELEVELFVRSRQGVALTPQGTYLKERCAFLLEYTEETLMNLKKIGAYPKENLKVSLTIGGRIIIPISMTEAFEKENPGIGISMIERKESECENDVLENLSHGAIIADPKSTGRFRVYPIAREPLCLMLHKDHILARKKSITYQDLHGLDLILIYELSRSNDKMLEFLKEENINVTINYRVPNLLSAMELCAEKRGGVIVVEKIKKKLSYPDIVFVPLSLKKLCWNLYFITGREQEENQKILRFVRYLQKKLNFQL